MANKRAFSASSANLRSSASLASLAAFSAAILRCNSCSLRILSFSKRLRSSSCSFWIRSASKRLRVSSSMANKRAFSASSAFLRSSAILRSSASLASLAAFSASILRCNSCSLRILSASKRLSSSSFSFWILSASKRWRFSSSMANKRAFSASSANLRSSASLASLAAFSASIWRCSSCSLRILSSSKRFSSCSLRILSSSKRFSSCSRWILSFSTRMRFSSSIASWRKRSASISCSLRIFSASKRSRSISSSFWILSFSMRMRFSSSNSFWIRSASNRCCSSSRSLAAACSSMFCFINCSSIFAPWSVVLEQGVSSKTSIELSTTWLFESSMESRISIVKEFTIREFPREPGSRIDAKKSSFPGIWADPLLSLAPSSYCWVAGISTNEPSELIWLQLGVSKILESSRNSSIISCLESFSVFSLFWDKSPVCSLLLPPLHPACIVICCVAGITSPSGTELSIKKPTEIANQENWLKMA